LNVHNISDVRQTEIHTADPQVSGPTHFEVEIAIEKLKNFFDQWKESIIVPVHKK
jgi:hypothetical protein